LTNFCILIGFLLWYNKIIKLVKKNMLNQEIDKIAKTNISNDKLYELLEKNLQMTESVYKLVNKTNKYLLWQQVFGFLKLIIIIIPLVLSFIYLPQILNGFLQQYQEALGVEKVEIDNSMLNGFDTKNLLDILK